MAKKCTYNAPFFNAFPARIYGTPVRFGVLIGSEVDDGLRDVLFAAPTPPQPMQEGDQNAPPAVTDVVATLKSKDCVRFAGWVAQHTAAIGRLLPGGLEPCGCFAVVAEAAARELAPLLAPTLQGFSGPLVLTIDPSTKKLTFWRYSSGAKPAMRPAQLKPDAHKDALLLSSATLVDIVMPSRASGGTTTDDIDILVADLERSLSAALDSCVFGIRTDAVDVAAPLRLVNEESEDTIGSTTPKDCNELRATLMHSGTVLTACGAAEAGPLLRQRCLIVATVLILRRDIELRHAAKLLRRSLISSAATRLQLAIEESEGGDSITLPWRALCRPSGTDLPCWCGDYCMPDEEPDVALERLGQLLGVPESDLEQAPVHLDEYALLRRDFAGTYEAEVADGVAAQSFGGKSKKGSLAIPSFQCVAALAALTLAVAAPLLLRAC